MPSFPNLRTGAVMQYPARREQQYSCQVVRFLDGTEQRFRDFAGPIRRWVVMLDNIDETELNSLRELFRSSNGAFGTFQFTDPWDGSVHENCRFESDQLADRLKGEGRAGSTFTIRED